MWIVYRAKMRVDSGNAKRDFVCVRFADDVCARFFEFFDHEGIAAGGDVSEKLGRPGAGGEALHVY